MPIFHFVLGGRKDDDQSQLVNSTTIKFRKAISDLFSDFDEKIIESILDFHNGQIDEIDDNYKRLDLR